MIATTKIREDEAMKFLAGSLIAAALALPTLASGASPKPWMWTPAQAGAAVVTWNPSVFPSYSKLNVKEARCRGLGKAQKGRYSTFRCLGGYGTKYSGVIQRATLWTRIRRVGKGQPCVSTKSLAAIPKPCLETSGRPRVVGSVDDAHDAHALALQAKYQLKYPWQGPTTCLGYGAGYYECAYGIDGVGMLVSQVFFTTAGPVVRLPGAPPTLPGG